MGNGAQSANGLLGNGWGEEDFHVVEQTGGKAACSPVVYQSLGGVREAFV